MIKLNTLSVKQTHLKKILFILLMIIVPAAVTFGPVYSLKPSGKTTKIESLITNETGQKIDLPLKVFERFGISKDKAKVKSLRAVIERCAGENAIFIPYYDGAITVQLDGLILSSSETQNKKPLLFMRHQLIRLNATNECKPENLVISIEPSNAIFSTLSKIYIGDYNKLLLNQNFVNFMQNDLRIITFTIALVFFLASIFLYLSNLTNRKSLFMIGYLFYLTFGSSLTFYTIWPDIINLQPVFIAFLPVSTIFIKLSGVVFSTASKYLNVSLIDKIILLAVGAWVFVILSSRLEHYYVQVINTFLFVNVFIIYLTFLVVSSTRRFMSPESEINFWVPIALTSFLVSSINELVVRIGGIGTTYYLTHIAALFVAVALSSIFFKSILSGSKRIAAQNEILALELQKNREKLILEYDLNMQLSEKQARNEEVAKFNGEMHDGMVTYLSMIVHLAHDEKTDQKFEIQRLAQTALDETRIILGIKNSEDENFFMAIATLRLTFQNAIKEKQITAHWDILSLMDHKCSRPEYVLDLVRIIQEAFNNAIFRSKCTMISVTATDLPNNGLCIRIDNTGGSPYNPESKLGMGLRNMKRRASKIGADFDIATLTTGASVSLTFEPQNQ